MLLAPIVPGDKGTRQIDGWGAGGFGAPRDGGTRSHEGLDWIAAPGDPIHSPICGRISHYGVALPQTTHDQLGTIWIEGEGPYEGVFVKLLYVRGLGQVGDRVHSGDRVGSACDVAGYYHRKYPKKRAQRGDMTNHVHEYLRIESVGPDWVDPAHYHLGV